MKYIAILIGLVAAQIGLVWVQQHTVTRLVDTLYEAKEIKETD